MRRQTSDSGVALIMLLGITACLVVLTGALVMLLSNQQHATARDSQTKTSLYYAEAGLDSAVNAAKATPGWMAGNPIDTSQMNVEYAAAYPSGPAVTYRVYDNAATVNASTPAFDANGDRMVWVQATATYMGETSSLRDMVSSNTLVSILPSAPLYSDSDITLSNSSDVYMVNNDNTPDTSGPPYATTVMCGGDYSASSTSDLAAPGSTVQSLGLQVNGRVSTPGHNFHPVPGGVGYLSDYFDQAHQFALTSEAQTGINTYDAVLNPTGTGKGFANASAAQYTSLTALQGAMTRTGTSPNYTYTASGDLKYSGNLTLSTSGTTYVFASLYVTGSLTISGYVKVTTTALYVGGDFTVTGDSHSPADSLGSVYVAGKIIWRGGSGGSSGGRLNITAGALYAKILSVDGNISGGDNTQYDGSSGPYDITLGDVWIDGDAGTGDIAVNFSGPSSGTASTVTCPLLATTEKTVSNGLVNFGSLESPMVYYMQCDNDGLYNNTCEWASTGQFTGLMILFEAPIQITGGVSAHPTIVGAVMDGSPIASCPTDITMSGSSTVCYNQLVINNLPPALQNILRTSTTTTVPGTWQQLSAH